MNIQDLKERSKITKIVSRRTIRSSDGEKTLELTQEFEGSHEEAEYAAVILSMQVDMAVLRHAFAGGLITADRFQDQMSSVKSSYGKLIVDFSGSKHDGKETA
jgi:hypothetical protein